MNWPVPLLQVLAGQEYFNAMAAAANFGWANRHVIAHNVREAFRTVLGARLR